MSATLASTSATASHSSTSIPIPGTDYHVDSYTSSLNAPSPLRPAPTFYPSEEEFKDPIAYVRSITHIGQRTGICKIVPPASWNPPFCLNDDKFTFRSKVQRLDLLQKRGEGGAASATTNSTPGGKRKSSSSSARANARRIKRAKQQNGSSVDPYWNTRCVICQGADHDSKILLCDECDQGFHLFCLSPPLSAIPQTDWYCPHCLADEINAFGFDMGRTFTLSEFQKHSDVFKEKWFTKRPSNDVGGVSIDMNTSVASSSSAAPTTSQSNGDATMTDVDAPADPSITYPSSSASSSSSSSSSFTPPTASEISESFWRILESPTAPVSIDYGSDLDTETLGSGFPRTGPYANLPWNVNNLALSKGSIINWLDESMLISGVTIPWLYVGMIFSTFCWHVEDHWMFSINYVHRGAPKQWYGVPSTSAGKFERKMRQALPNLFNLNPDLLFQLVTMLNPLKLATHDGGAASSSSSSSIDSSSSDDPTLYYLLQEPGTFTITFPRSYHAGFNHGFNVAESVNFGGVEWMPFGSKCIERYRFFRRTPIFNHEELVMRMCMNVISAFEEKILKQQKVDVKYKIRNRDADAIFHKSMAAIAAAATVSSLHSTAQRNQQLSLSSFKDIWYFAAWLLHQLQELISREVAGRNALLGHGTLRGKLWLPDAPMNVKVESSTKRGSSTSGAFVPLALGSIVSATWQGNPAFNAKAPTDPSLFVWYDGTLTGWNSSTGHYSVRYHEDGLVDDHVLPKHVKLKNPPSGAKQAAVNNEWLQFQACIDDTTEGGDKEINGTEGTTQKEDASETNGGGGRTSKMNGGASSPMKKAMKLKKSAVDFTPSVSNVVACAICRHALYLSCVRCSCCPEKASCLVHAQELCACKGESKTIYFRYAIWQMQNVLHSIQQVVNYRENDHSSPSSSSSSSTRLHTCRPSKYNSFNDSYEVSSDATDFPLLPSDSTKVSIVRSPYESEFPRENPKQDPNPSYKLTMSTMCPIFTMGLEDGEEDVVPLDEIAPVVVEGTTEEKSEPQPRVDETVPSTRALASILAESRRIISEPDDYVAAVGLRDENLAKAAKLSEEQNSHTTRQNIEARTTAVTQPKSSHHSTLRSAVRFSLPTAQPTAKDMSHEVRLKLRKDADVWKAKYAGWITQAEQMKNQPTTIAVPDANTRTNKVEPIDVEMSHDFEESKSGEKVEPRLNGNANPAMSMHQELLSKPTLITSLTPQPSSSSTIVEWNTTKQPPLIRSQTEQTTNTFSSSSHSSSLSFHTHSFLTPTEFDVALYEGEKFIHGDDSMLDVCEMYGVLLSWHVQSQALASKLCSLVKCGKSLQSKSRKLKETLDRQWSELTVGLAVTMENNKRGLNETGQMQVEQVQQLLTDIAACPIQLVCSCGSVTTNTKPSTSIVTDLPLTSMTPAMMAALTHIECVHAWLRQLPQVQTSVTNVMSGDVTNILQTMAKLPCSPATSETFQTDATALQMFVMPHTERLQQLSSLPFKLPEKSLYLSFIKTMMDYWRLRVEPMFPASLNTKVATANKSPVKAPIQPSKNKQLPTVQREQRAVSNGFTIGAGVNGSSSKSNTQHTSSKRANEPTSYTFGGTNSTLPSGAPTSSSSTSYQLSSTPSSISPYQPAPILQRPDPMSIGSDGDGNDDFPSSPPPTPLTGSPASQWLQRVSSLLGPRASPPLFALVYQEFLLGKKLFPSLAQQMTFDSTLLQMIREGVLTTAETDGISSTDVPNLIQMIQRLVALCWSGVFWLTQARRLLMCASESPSLMLTQIETRHSAPADELNSLPIPPLLQQWATNGHEEAKRVYDQQQAQLQDHSHLPWCPDTMSHVASVSAKSNASSIAGELISPHHSRRYSMCCAFALLQAPVLTYVDIPEARILEFHAQQSQEWKQRAETVLAASCYTAVGLRASKSALERELASHSHAPLDSAEFQSSGSRNSTAFLCGICWEGLGLGFLVPEAFLLASHLKRVQEWQRQVCTKLQQVFNLYLIGADLASSEEYRTNVKSAIAKSESFVREGMKLNVWTEEMHSAITAYRQGRSILYPQGSKAQQQQQLGQQETGAVSSSNGASSSSAAAATNASAPFRAKPIRTIGEMLERVDRMTNDPLISSLPYSSPERELLQGCSADTASRYRQHVRAAEAAGINLADYANISYGMILPLVEATPTERKDLVDQLSATGTALNATSLFETTGGGGRGRRSNKGGQQPDESEDEDAAADDDDMNDAGETVIAGMPAYPPGSQKPVPHVDLLDLPLPTPVEKATPGHVYCSATVEPGKPNERKRLRSFVHARKFFSLRGLLPYQDETFGLIHQSRKNAAIRMIQDEFHTSATWTRNFLSSTHANHRRLHLAQTRPADPPGTAPASATKASKASKREDMMDED